MTVVDALPPGLTYVSASVTTPAGSCAESADRVECSLDDPLPPLGSATLIVTAAVEVGAYPSVTNPAVVSSTTPDTDDSNNTAEDVVSVPPLVDLQISKSHADAFLVGQQATYQLEVRNAGPTEDPGPVTMVDQLPAGLTYVSAVGVGWTCAAQSQTVTCTLPVGWPWERRAR